MLPQSGFDNKKYSQEQSSAILERIERLGGKLYLEIGGKIINDLHASRVLSGFDPNAKIKILKTLKEKIQVIVCVFSEDIQSNASLRGDLGITNDICALKLIDDLRYWGLEVAWVVLTRFNGQEVAAAFANKLEKREIKVAKHTVINGYPDNVEKIASENGFGKNQYLQTEKPLILVVAPSANSGKLSTCLSQLYHEQKKGVKAGYAKWETFPIWNLPLLHPVNIAYEASTADIGDFNLVDPFHQETYKEIAINYNRDVEIFPVLKKILTRINGANSEKIYASPTDMGVNKAGFAIIDDLIVQEASKQEIIRRYFRYSWEFSKGIGSKNTIKRVEKMMEDLNIIPEMRKVVNPARQAAETAKQQSDKGHKGVYSASAIELKNGKIVTGKNSALMRASSSLLLNAIKELSKIPDEIHLLSPEIIQAISQLKKSLTGDSNLSLNLEEILIALSIASVNSPETKIALEKVGELSGCEVHLTHIPKPGDENSWRKLKVNLTYDPIFSSPDLFEN